MAVSSAAIAQQNISLPRYIMTPAISEYERFNVYRHTCLNPKFPGVRGAGKTPDGRVFWKFDPWQVDRLRQMAFDEYDERMLLRCRGGSKSRDGTVLAVWFGYQKSSSGSLNLVIWYAASEKQLNIAKNYFKYNRYVNWSKSTASKIVLLNGNEILIKIASKKQAASDRSDIIFFDEEQDIEPEIYDLIIGTGVGGDIKMIHMGTTELDTVLHDNFIKLNPEGNVLQNLVTDLSWTTETKELRRYAGRPDFVIQSQLYCQWVQSGGAVFTKIEASELNPSDEIWRVVHPMFFYGCDPNPKSGHAMVLVRYFPTRNTIYVEHEFDTTADSFEFAEIIGDVIEDERAYLEIEENAGEEFVKILWKVLEDRNYLGTYKVQRWDEKEKGNRVFKIRTFNLIVNPACEETLRHIRSARWKEKEPTAKIDKRPDQHYLDAFIHACSLGSQGALII